MAGTSTPKTAYSRGYRLWLLILLMLIYTSNFVDRSILGVLAQPIKRDLNLSDTQLGMLGGLAFAVFFTGLGLPLARLADRTNRVRLIAVCTAIWSVMTAVCGLAQNFAQLALARVGVGVGEAGCVPSAQSLISDHFPPNRRGAALAVFSLGIPIGSLIGAVAGGWIAQHLSWRIAFMMVGLPGLLLAIIAPLTLREPARGMADVAATADGPTPSLMAALKTLLGKPGVLWMCAAASVSAAGTYGVGAWLAPYLVRRFDLDLAQAGLVSGLASSVPMLLSNLGGGYVADLTSRRNRRGYALTSAAAVAIAVPLFLLAFNQAGLAAAMVLLTLAGVFQQGYLAPTFAVANNAVPARMRATSVAILSFVWNLVGLGLGPLIVGAVSDHMAGRLADGGSGSDPLNLCRHAASSAACADPSAAGLAYALMHVVAGYAVGAVLFLVAARTLDRDLEPS